MKNLLLLLVLASAMTANAQLNINGIDVKTPYDADLHELTSEKLEDGRRYKMATYLGDYAMGVRVVPNITPETLVNTLREFSGKVWNEVKAGQYGNGMDAFQIYYEFDTVPRLKKVVLATVVKGSLVVISINGTVSYDTLIKQANYTLGYVYQQKN